MAVSGTGRRHAGRSDQTVEKHANEIRLVITDVVMPEMNGRELAERLLKLYTGIRIMFMSGYTADVIIHRGVLNEKINFIQKPFSMKDLALKVREVVWEKAQ